MADVTPTGAVGPTQRPKLEAERERSSLSRRFSFVFFGMGVTLVLCAVAGAFVLLGRPAPRLIVEPISVPSEMWELGYSEHTLSQRLQGAFSAVVAASDPGRSRDRVRFTADQVVVSGADEVSRLDKVLAKVWGQSVMTVHGALTCMDARCLMDEQTLHLRLVDADRSVVLPDVPIGDFTLEGYLTERASDLLRVVDPYMLARFAERTGGLAMARDEALEVLSSQAADGAWAAMLLGQLSEDLEQSLWYFAVAEAAARSHTGGRMPELYEAWGRKLLAEGHHNEAVSRFETAIAQDPEFAEAHAGLALALSSLNRNPEAYAAFASAVGLRPGYIDAHLAWGQQLARAGLHVDAAERFTVALAWAPASKEAFTERGRSRMALGWVEAAFNDFDEALLIDRAYRPAQRAWMQSFVRWEITDCDLLRTSLARLQAAVSRTNRTNSFQIRVRQVVEECSPKPLRSGLREEAMVLP